MNLKWIGQSGYILNDANTEICIDPYLSDVVDKVADRGRLVPCPIEPQDLKSNVVICTHDHLDHLDSEAIKKMDKENKVFVCPTDCIEHLNELGVKHIQRLNEGDNITFGNFNITGVFADHTIVAIGLLIKHCGKTLYFTGDTFYHKKIEEMKQYDIDYMFICINGKLGNMNVDEAIKLTSIINPKVGIPTHYGMFASNTENPNIYIDQVENGFEMEFNKDYFLNEIG